MYSEEEKRDMHAIAKHIHDRSKNIMRLIEETDVNDKMNNRDLIDNWQKISDDLMHALRIWGMSLRNKS